MNRFISFLLFLMVATVAAEAQTSADLNWTWMKGGQYASTVPHYGIKGVEASENQPPSRRAAATWTDVNGQFWLFGGSPNNGSMFNDLWRFNPVNQRWTWIAGDSIPNQEGDYGTLGQASPNNLPKARNNAVAWCSFNNELWLFGGSYNYSGVSYGELGDLWKFNIQTLQWTWMGGSRLTGANANYGIRGIAQSTNYPGATSLANSWTDFKGRFWMYGGFSFRSTGNVARESGLLWMFDPETRLWTWVKGEVSGSDYQFGTQQVPDEANTPGPRLMSITWSDPDGNLWLFGGELLTGRKGNDLWKYSIATNTWVWMKGSTPPTDVGGYWPAVYGIKDVVDDANNPGSRQGGMGWMYGNTKLLMLGGLGTVTEHNLGYLNDLWSYDIPTNRWTWIKGDSLIDAPGDYGNFQQTANGNLPPGRAQSASWQDRQGNTWIFGGDNHLGDLWRMNGKAQTDSAHVILRGQAVAEDVQLNWESTIEWGTGYYELQRSSDQVLFTPIVQVPARGNASLPNQYDFLDTTALVGINYYRLKVMQRLGRYFYSDTIAVAIGKPAQGAIIFPNPTPNILYYQSNDANEAKWQVQVLDVLGHTLIEKAWINYSGALQSLDVSFLPAGIYILRVLKPGKIQNIPFEKIGN